MGQANLFYAEPCTLVGAGCLSTGVQSTACQFQLLARKVIARDVSDQHETREDRNGSISPVRPILVPIQRHVDHQCTEAAALDACKFLEVRKEDKPTKAAY